MILLTLALALALVVAVWKLLIARKDPEKAKEESKKQKWAAHSALREELQTFLQKIEDGQDFDSDKVYDPGGFF